MNLYEIHTRTFGFLLVFFLALLPGCKPSSDSHERDALTREMEYLVRQAPVPVNFDSIGYYTPEKVILQNDAVTLYENLHRCDYDLCLLGVGSDDGDYLEEVVSVACTELNHLANKSRAGKVSVYLFVKRQHRDQIESTFRKCNHAGPVLVVVPSI